MIEKYILDLLFVLIGAAIVGGVGLIVNGLKSEIREMKDVLKAVVIEPLCKERRSSMEKDINNLGELVREALKNG